MYGEAQGKRPADKHVLSGRTACRACLPSQQVVPGMWMGAWGMPYSRGHGGHGAQKNVLFLGAGSMHEPVALICTSSAASCTMPNKAGEPCHVLYGTFKRDLAGNRQPLYCEIELRNWRQIRVGKYTMGIRWITSIHCLGAIRDKKDLTNSRGW